MNIKKSISNDYIKLIALCITMLIILSGMWSYYIYYSEKNLLNSELVKASKKAENLINSSFKYSTSLAEFLGSQILNVGPNNFDKIHDIISGKYISNTIASNAFSYTLFDWVNTKNELVISGPYGILKKSRDVSFRNYAKMAKKEPWKFHFDKPDYGIPSGQFVLPAGMGITDHDGRFQGIVTMGFSLSNLNKKVEEEINDPKINYILISDENDFLFGSNFIGKNDKKVNLTELSNLIPSDKRHGYLEDKYHIYHTTYLYFRSLDKYPYKIIMGYDRSLLNREIFYKLYVRLIEILCFGSVSIVLLITTKKKIIKPLITLSDIAKDLSQGKINVVIPEFSSYEMNILSNQLRKIESYTKQLFLVKNELEQQVSERTFELEHALAAKTEFLNNMSHEIRTPVLGFTSISEGLVEQWPELEDARRFKLATVVADNAKRLGRLVGNLLDLSKFSAGKMLLDIEPFDILTLADELKDECETLYFNNRPLTLEVINETNQNSLNIEADRERIAQVLRNLLVNAIKSSPNDGIVKLLISDSKLNYDNGHKQQAVCIRVQDSGYGIPEAELELIFKPFVQSSKTKTRAGGTGLGLSICKQIAAAHHGKIWATNLQPTGAEFHFIIPLNYSEKLDEVAEPQQMLSAAVANFQANKNRTQPITILMIDDEDGCHMSMSMILHSAGYHLISALGGVDGKQQVTDNYQQIDIILLDLMMPDIYGLNMLKWLKSQPGYAHIPVILQSGTSDEQEINKAFELGAVAYIRKPYEKAKILNELKQLLNG